MIAVDSSAWIDQFKGRRSRQTRALDEYLTDPEIPVLIGDIVMYEVLIGASSAREEAQIRTLFETLLLVRMLDFDLVPRAVANYQTLRRLGITIGTVDMVIGTWCLENGATLLTGDAGFEPLAEHLGLRLA